MERRTFLHTMASGLAAIPGAAGGKARENVTASRRPNILLIQADMRRWDTIAGRSVCRTPHLDRLAAEGVLFNRSYTATAPCCPARAMLASGAYHWHNGVWNQVHSAPSVSRDMIPDVVTYYHRLRAAGYHMGYIGKWHASYARTPMDFGFHEIHAPLAYNPELLKNLDVPDDWKTPPHRRGRRTPLKRVRWPGGEPMTLMAVDEGREEDTECAILADECIAFLRRRARSGTPWHAEVHFTEGTRFPLRQYYERYDPAAIPVDPSFYDTFGNKPGFHRREAESWGVISEEEFRQYRACHYAYCEQQDAQIGRILRTLDDLGEAGNTLVVFCADHGDMAGDHHMWWIGWMPYEGINRIPMIVRWPGVAAAGAATDHLVQIHDLAHTFTDVAGGEPLPHRDGDSLVPLWRDPGGVTWRDQILQAYNGGEFLYSQRKVVTDRYKYVFNGFDFDELYDLETDPHELYNRVDDRGCREIVDDMRARVYELMARYEDPLGDNPPPGPGASGRPTQWCAPRYLPRGKRLNREVQGP